MIENNLKTRLIAVLIMRDGVIVQSVGFNHTNVIHSNPVIAIEHFYKWEVDEVVILNVGRSDTGWVQFMKTVKEITENCFVPVAVGGWVNSLGRIEQALRGGADKVVINTEAFLDPSFMERAARRYGRQCIVVSIDSKRTKNGFEVFIDRGRKATGYAAHNWAQIAQQTGAGEILITSIDNDGSREGYDIGLLRKVVDAVSIPVISFGGVQEWSDLIAGVQEGGADAVALANALHYVDNSARKAKRAMRRAGINVR